LIHFSGTYNNCHRRSCCKYPVRRGEVKVDTVPTGNMIYVQDNMFLGQLLKRLVIAYVDSDALNDTIPAMTIVVSNCNL
jgi:hypothetical protein